MQPLTVIAACWLILIVVWIVAAVVQKQGLGDSSWTRSSWLLRLGLAVSILVIVKIGGSHVFESNVSNVAIGWVGAAITVAGLGLGVWARLTLGRSWAWPMTKKAETALVTSGPYHWIRHPIYSALTLVYIGTSLAISYFLFIPFLIMVAYLVHAMSNEEAEMRRQFGERYKAYMLRTKMLVPWVI